MLTLLQTLFGRTPTAATPAPELRHAPPVVLAPVDPPDLIETLDTSRQTLRWRRLAIDPVFVLIEYADAQGEITRRRVTLRTIEISDTAAVLRGTCHERKAPRGFRADRLRRVFDSLGAELDPDEFVSDLIDCGEPLPDAAPGRPPAPRKTARVSPYTGLRRQITPGLVLLTASARSDDLLHPGEVDVILRWCEDEAMDLCSAGTIAEMPNAQDFDRLDRTLRRLRPMAEDVSLALGQCSRWNALRLRQLARALVRCAKADGRVDATEAAIAEALMQEGARAHGFGWQD